MKNIIWGGIVGLCISWAGTQIMDDPIKFGCIVFVLLFSSSILLED